MSESSREIVKQTIEELDHLISAKLSEDELWLLCTRKLGLTMYRPAAHRTTYQQWLEAVRSLLKE